MSPLFTDAYVASLQHGRRSWRESLKGYWQRIKTLLDTKDVDVIWIEKEALPWLPAGIEQYFLAKGIPYVLDYDDAVFHLYDLHSNPWVRGLLAKKHPSLMQKAALVVAGNDYLAEYAQAAGAKQVTVLPTVIDLERYPPPSFGASSSNGIPCIGWIGQRATASYLLPLASIMHQLIAEKCARFMAVGVDAATLGLPMASVPWSEETEVAAIRKFNVGIMPLPDEPFERGKCGYKLIQYMACGLPVVASPVGVNSKIVEHGVNGFLATTTEEWEWSLRSLITKPDLRQQMGQQGRLKVEREYCLQVTAPKLITLLCQIVPDKK